MKIHSSNYLIISFLLLAGLSFFSCGEDDISTQEPISILPYNSSKHVYGMLASTPEGRQEVVIDPITGQFNRLPETQVGTVAGSLEFPIGTKIIDRFRKKRKYIS